MQVSYIIWHVIQGDESLSGHCHGDDGSDGDVRHSFCVSHVTSESDAQTLQIWLYFTLLKCQSLIWTVQLISYYYLEFWLYQELY